MSSEADLLALMRADRQVQNRRRAAQLLIDLKATEAVRLVSQARARTFQENALQAKGIHVMSKLVARLRAEVDEDVNEPLDRLLDEAAVRVEALEMRLVEMLAKCSWAKREQWCGCVDCHCVLARRFASRPGIAPARPDTRQDQRRA